jgi:hypothetical protein
MRRATLLLSISVIFACTGEASREGPPADTAVRPLVRIDSAQHSATCKDADPADTLVTTMRVDEALALACWRTHARRSGDTLILAKEGTGEVRLVDNRSDGEGTVTYRFRGAVLRRYWIVDIHGYESGHTLLVDMTSGEQTHFVALPVASPNGAYLAAASRSLDIAEGSTRLEIWQVQVGAPVLDFSLDPFNPARPEEGWGPGNVVWRSADTLLVPRYRAAEGGGTGEALKDTVYIVRTSAGWRLITGHRTNNHDREFLPS